MLYTQRIAVVLGSLLVISTASLAQDNQITSAEKKAGWQLLFDGKTNAGWKGAYKETFPEKGWKIDQGLLIVEPSDGGESTNGGDIVSENVYSDFELSVDFKLTEGANSGIKYFVASHQATPASPRSAIGLEFQLLDDEKHPDAKQGKNGNRTLGSLYDLIPAISSKPVKPIGDWNNARIVAIGNKVEHWLNGIKVVQFERGSSQFNALVAESKYKNIAQFGLHKSGRILLQDHGNRVYFKNIKIRTSNLAPVSKTTKLLKNTPGVVSYTFRNSFQRNLAATLDTVKAMGFTNIEFSNLFGKKAAEIRQLLEERGMKCTSFGTGYPELVNKTAEVAENAKALGASFVRVAWIPHDKPFTLEAAKKAVEDFNTAGKMLKEKYGLNFCYHNHGYEFLPYENGTYFDYIVANTNPAYVSFEMDILWVAFPGADPVALLKKYPNRFKLMHVKDLRKGIKGDFSGGTPVENDVTLGTGQINIPAILKAARNTSIEHFYIEDESKDVHLQVPLSLSYLQQL